MVTPDVLVDREKARKVLEAADGDASRALEMLSAGPDLSSKAAAEDEPVTASQKQDGVTPRTVVSSRGPASSDQEETEDFDELEGQGHDGEDDWAAGGDEQFVLDDEGGGDSDNDADGVGGAFGDDEEAEGAVTVGDGDATSEHSHDGADFDWD